MRWLLLALAMLPGCPASDCDRVCGRFEACLIRLPGGCVNACEEREAEGGGSSATCARCLDANRCDELGDCETLCGPHWPG